MITTTPSPAPVERIKAVNHHLRVALDEVSEAVLILQNGLSPGDGPVIAWGNAAAVRCIGVPGAELFGSPLQPLLTGLSWQALITALTGAFHGVAEPCELSFANPATPSRQGRVKATLGPKGEILGVILTLTPLPEPTSGAASDSTDPFPKPDTALRCDGPPPSPQGWQEDVIETIRETARQVAHEFNNALTSIVLPVQLAIRAIPQNGDLYESLEVAHVSAQRASDLAKDFLDCFRPRSAVRSRCAPAALLGRSIRLATCAQNVSSVTEIEDGLPEIEADESQLERVIFNLIRNSCQAMPSGGRLRVAAVKRELRGDEGIALPPGPYLQISVRDWGPGIPEEHLQHLFHGRFTTKPEGNGCGLPICYQIVRDHGGEMLVRSRVNVGTEFLIYIPVAAAAGLPAVPAAPAPPNSPPVPAAPASAMANVPGLPAGGPPSLTSPVTGHTHAVAAVPSAYPGGNPHPPGLPPLVPLVPSLAKPAENLPHIAASTGWPVPFSAPATSQGVPPGSHFPPAPPEPSSPPPAVPAWPTLPPLPANDGRSWPTGPLEPPRHSAPAAQAPMAVPAVPSAPPLPPISGNPPVLAPLFSTTASPPPPVPPAPVWPSPSPSAPVGWSGHAAPAPAQVPAMQAAHAFQANGAPSPDFDASTAPALPAIPSTAEEPPPSLLVVDDEQGVRTALSQIAKIMGFDVATVGTSDEALQSYKDRLHASRPFSTVLLDLNLRSGLNGMEVFQAIRRMDPEALVVATSGQHAEGDVERFRSLGFAGFLPKPYSLEHFDSVMRAALAS